MNRVFFTVFLLVSFWSTAFAQKKVTYEATKSYRATITRQEYFVVDEVNNRYLSMKNVFRLGASKVNISSIDVETMQQVAMASTELPIKNSYIINAVVLDGRPHLVIGSKDGDKRSVHSLVVNSETATFEGEPKLLFSYDDEAHNKGLRVIHSDEEQHLAFLLYENYKRADAEQLATLQCYIVSDRYPDHLHHLTITLPYSHEDAFLDFTSVTAPKKVALLSSGLYMEALAMKVKEGSKRSRKVKQREFIRTDLTTGQTTPLKMATKGNKLVNSRFVENAEGQAMLVGCYHDQDAPGHEVAGFFTLPINEDGQPGHIQFHDIPQKLVFQYESSNLKRAKDPKLITFWRYLKINDVVFGQDGSMVIHSEIRLNLSGRIGYLDLYSMKINSDGTMAWTIKVPKHQEGSNEPNSFGVFTMHYNDKHYFLYIDDPKNVTIEEGKAPTPYGVMSKRVLYLATIDDATGQVERRQFLDFKDNETQHNFYWTYLDAFRKVGERVIMAKVFTDINNEAALKIAFPE